MHYVLQLHFNFSRHQSLTSRLTHSDPSDARFVLAAEPPFCFIPSPPKIPFRVGKQSDMKDRSVRDGEAAPDAINLPPLLPVTPVFYYLRLTYLRVFLLLTPTFTRFLSRPWQAITLASQVPYNSAAHCSLLISRPAHDE